MKEEKDGQNINSIIRAIDILNLYKNDKIYYGITEISNILEIPKTTVFRIVKTLESKGWLIKEDITNQYKLGFEILNVTSSITRDYNNRDIIIEEMKKLAKEFNENVVLHAYENYTARCIEKIETDNVVKISSEIGKKAPLHVGASSKIILAYQNSEIIDQVINEDLIKYTEKTIVDKNMLYEDLAEIRRQGYSISFGELDVGVTAIAVPIIANEEFLYGLSIIAPTSRILLKGIEEVKSSLLESTKRIHKKINMIENLL